MEWLNGRGPVTGGRREDKRQLRLHRPDDQEKVAQEDDLKRRLECFWTLESSGLFSASKGRSPKDNEVQKLWEARIRALEGLYQLPIPFKQPNPHLPKTRAMAEKRLSGLRKRLEHNQTLRQQYGQEMEKLLDKAHVIRVPTDQLNRDDGLVQYLPYHPVINPNKEKPRIVFDCAAQQRGVSLNDAMHSGPDLTNSLVRVLCRFPLKPVAFMADIEAMFHQVKVAPAAPPWGEGTCDI